MSESLEAKALRVLGEEARGVDIDDLLVMALEKVEALNSDVGWWREVARSWREWAAVHADRSLLDRMRGRIFNLKRAGGEIARYAALLADDYKAPEEKAPVSAFVTQNRSTYFDIFRDHPDDCLSVPPPPPTPMGGPR